MIFSGEYQQFGKSTVKDPPRKWAASHVRNVEEENSFVEVSFTALKQNPVTEAIRMNMDAKLFLKTTSTFVVLLCSLDGKENLVQRQITLWKKKAQVTPKNDTVAILRRHFDYKVSTEGNLI